MTDLRPHLNSICEPGCTRAFGVWTEGHRDWRDFAFAVSAEYGREIDMREVHRGYYRVLRGVMHFTSARGRGAAPVTWTEW